MLQNIKDLARVSILMKNESGSITKSKETKKKWKNNRTIKFCWICNEMDGEQKGVKKTVKNEKYSIK